MAQRMEGRAKAILATRFVNMNTQEAADRFLREHGENIRPDCRHAVPLLHVAKLLRLAWDSNLWTGGEFALRLLFADHNRGRFLATKAGEAELAHIPLQSFDQLEFARPAFDVKLGSPVPVFAARDLIDEVAYTILTAAAHGLLRYCEGSLKKWACPAPFLVADEQRRRFCYSTDAKPGCGDEAKSVAKREWGKHQREEEQLKKQKRRRHDAQPKGPNRKN
jgi:hypothetical protein